MTRAEVYAVLDGERAHQAKAHPTREESAPLSVGEEIALVAALAFEAQREWAIFRDGGQSALHLIRKALACGVRLGEHHGLPRRLER
jgi:hypothetical protein